MTTPAATPATSVVTTGSGSRVPVAASEAVPERLNEDTSFGVTKINDSVIAKVAGIAAREVRGVHDLGGSVGRAIGALRDRLNQQDHAQGITVEVGETQAAVDVTLIADYPVSLQEVADGVRAAVIEAIESLVGLEVTEVNVTITDVVIPSEDDDAAANTPARVQ